MRENTQFIETESRYESPQVYLAALTSQSSRTPFMAHNGLVLGLVGKTLSINERVGVR
jgi:hypothetical protein